MSEPTTPFTKKDRKTAHDAFNKDVKRVLREMRDTFPEVASGVGMILLALKVTKRIGRKLPCRYFAEMVSQPFGDRFLARDGAFFESDAFAVAGYEGLVNDIQIQWKRADAGARDLVWRRMGDLLAACAALQPN